MSFQTKRSGRVKLWTVLAGITAVFALSTLDAHRTTPRAHAGPPSAYTPLDKIPHTPPSKKGPKPTPVPVARDHFPPVSACARAKYDELALKVPLIRAKHLTDDAAFMAEYLKEKQALVGPKALAAVGCGK